MSSKRVRIDLLKWCKENNCQDILEEWDYERNTDLRPCDVTIGSGKNIWWKCSKGHVLAVAFETYFIDCSTKAVIGVK